MIKWHKADLLNRMYVNLPDGKKASMPRYYKDKIYNHWERVQIANEFKYQKEKQDNEYYSNYTAQAEADKAGAVAQAFRKMHWKNKQTGSTL